MCRHRGASLGVTIEGSMLRAEGWVIKCNSSKQKIRFELTNFTMTMSIHLCDLFKNKY